MAIEAWNEVHAAHHHPEGVFSRQFARGADGPGPVELDVRPVTKPDFLFEQPAWVAARNATQL